MAVDEDCVARVFTYFHSVIRTPSTVVVDYQPHLTNHSIYVVIVILCSYH